MASSSAEILWQIEDAIRRTGWHGVGVFGEPDDPDHPYGTEPFTYTVGLRTTWGHPDVVICALPPAVAHGLLETVVSAIEKGRTFAAGDQADDIIVGLPVRFGEVGDAARAELRICAAVYGTERGATPALQLIWPDAEGRFPGDVGYTIDAQRVLA